VILAAMHHLAWHLRDVTVETLAAAVKISPGHLLELFKAGIGLTLRDFIARVRVEAIKQRLRDPGHAGLEALAEEVGLCHASHLSRLFMRYVKETPGHYRGNVQDFPGSVH
jgi:AraC-like DNA-binding protein